MYTDIAERKKNEDKEKEQDNLNEPRKASLVCITVKHANAV